MMDVVGWLLLLGFVLAILMSMRSPHPKKIKKRNAVGSPSDDGDYGDGSPPGKSSGVIGVSGGPDFGGGFSDGGGGGGGE